MKFEEVIPALREGYSIRHVSWPKEDFVYIKDGCFYDQDGCSLGIMARGIINLISIDGWEIVAKHKVEEPEPDWSYIVKNKCLCRFWDSDSEEVLSCKFRYLKEVDSRKTYPYKDEFGYTWKHCRPVRRDEINFYEEKEDEDNS